MVSTGQPRVDQCCLSVSERVRKLGNLRWETEKLPLTSAKTKSPLVHRMVDE